RQRVGFARALVVEPDALLMDEPFSALDVLTAQNLRAELLRLWQERDFPTKALLIVTHNIEEAVILADRIFVLGSNPGRIRTEITVTLPQPRNRHEESFQSLVDQIYGLMTGRDAGPAAHVWTAVAPGEGTPTDTPLPDASVGGMAGLLEIVVSQGGQVDLPKLAHELSFEVDDLLPLIDAAQVLGLAEVADADLRITDEGRVFVAADILESKQIFARLARERAPLVRAIYRSLDSTREGSIDERFFLDLLRRGFSEEEAREQLRIAIDWGRYGELFDFDADTGQLTMERPEAADTPAGAGTGAGGQPVDAVDAGQPGEDSEPAG
ncbi:MAG TPA: AAA-associated domain-containing protein, partial [Acidimicrobiales bacterium]|nr:AAA-associated domain-containing protein [Acidimicrobiales bacterium]